MSGNKRIQKVGKKGCGLQADHDIIVQNGLSYTEAKEVFSDLFRANFYQLEGIAKQAAQECMKEFNTNFLKQLEKKNPEGLQLAKTPAFMATLFEAQKGYVKSGDKDLGDLLIDLLVDRSKEKDRSLKQLILDESIKVTSKITMGQINVLSLIFLFRETRRLNIGSHNDLGKYLDENLLPLIDNLATNNTSLLHLEYIGCGTIIANHPLEKLFAASYPHIFSLGFPKSTQEELKIPADLVCQCLNDDSTLQLYAANEDTVKDALEKTELTSAERTAIQNLFSQNVMPDNKIKEKCIEIRPYMEKVFNLWSESSIQSFRPTGVGIAIGHANIIKKIGEFAKLDIWVNDKP